LAVAMKSAYHCDGITVRQNNEPASNQHAFHFHQHVFPRYTGDLYEKQSPDTKFLSDPQLRLQYVEKLKAELKNT
jgi:histidine triad (HIT) family protein